MSLSRRWFFIYSLAAFALAGCRGQAPTEDVDDSSAAPTVPVVHPVRQTITRKIQQPGYLKPYQQTPIYSKIAGYVEDVKVDIGDSVKEGDLLLVLYVPELVQALNAKKARVSQALAEVKQADETRKATDAGVKTAEAQVQDHEAAIKQADAEAERWNKELARARNLFEQRVFDKLTLDESQNQADQAAAGRLRAAARLNSAQFALAESKAKLSKAAADVEAARARLDVAEADREEAKAILDYREIRAPYDGIVTLRNVHKGHFLQSSTSGSTNKSAEPLFVVMSWQTMRINVQVPEYDAGLVADGMPALVRFPSLTIPEMTGRVTRTTWSYDEQARTLRAEIHLPNPNKILHPGMYAHAVISVQSPDVLTLPTEALMHEGDGMYVYAIEGGKAVRTAVQAGIKTDRLTQVLRKQERHIGSEKSDLWLEFTGREDIVARNPTSLIDGQSVTPAPGK